MHALLQHSRDRAKQVYIYVPRAATDGEIPRVAGGTTPNCNVGVGGWVGGWEVLDLSTGVRVLSGIDALDIFAWEREQSERKVTICYVGHEPRGRGVVPCVRSRHPRSTRLPDVVATILGDDSHEAAPSPTPEGFH